MVLKDDVKGIRFNERATDKIKKQADTVYKWRTEGIILQEILTNRLRQYIDIPNLLTNI